MSCRRDCKQDQQGLYYMAFLSCTQNMLKNTAAFLLRHLQATTSTIQQAADCCPGGRVLVILQVMQPAFTNPAAASWEWVQNIPCLGAQRRGQCLLQRSTAPQCPCQQVLPGACLQWPLILRSGDIMTL